MQICATFIKTYIQVTFKMHPTDDSYNFLYKSKLNFFSIKIY